MILNSVEPCTEYLTFGPWIYLVPQFKPRSMLMLGYSGGTVAGLTRLLYGFDFPIIAVDRDLPEKDPTEYAVDFIQADVKDFEIAHHEVIVVDLWDYDVPEIVFTEEFVQRVASKCDYLIIHCMEYSDMSTYAHLPKVRTLGLEYGARFHYFMVNRVARAPFRGRV